MRPPNHRHVEDWKSVTGARGRRGDNPFCRAALRFQEGGGIWAKSWRVSPVSDFQVSPRNQEHKLPRGANLEVKPSSCTPASTFATPCHFLCIPSRSSYPISNQSCISPKTSTCHTTYLWFWKPNIYLGRSIPNIISQNQECVCEE